MASSISGSTGISGATVSYTGTASGSVTADAYGNYSVTGLSNGSYSLSASLTGYTFTGAQNVTIAGSNVTGINFTATFVIGGYTFTVAGSETFTEANASPLNPSLWSQLGSEYGYTPLKVSSNRCEATDTASVSGERYIGASVLDAQFGSIKVQKCTAEEFDILLQADVTSSVGYDFFFIDNGDGTADVGIEDNEVNIVYENVALPWANNDVFMFACIGLTLLAFQNGVLIGQGTESVAALTGGLPTLAISTDTIGNVRLVDWIAGSLVANGDVYDSTVPFIGSVRVVTQAPSGATNPFAGTYKVLASAPSSIDNPYLGNVVSGAGPYPTPGQTGNPVLGQVVVVDEAPIDSDPFLGTIESA